MSDSAPRQASTKKSFPRTSSHASGDSHALNLRQSGRGLGSETRKVIDPHHHQEQNHVTFHNHTSAFGNEPPTIIPSQVFVPPDSSSASGHDLHSFPFEPTYSTEAGRVHGFNHVGSVANASKDPVFEPSLSPQGVPRFPSNSSTTNRHHRAPEASGPFLVDHEIKFQAGSSGASPVPKEKHKDTKEDAERKRKIKSQGEACSQCKSKKRRCDGNTPCEHCMKLSVPEPCNDCKSFKTKYREFMYCEKCTTRKIVCERVKSSTSQDTQQAHLGGFSNKDESALRRGISSVEYLGFLALRATASLISTNLRTPFKELAKRNRRHAAHCSRFVLEFQEDFTAPSESWKFMALDRMTENQKVEIFDSIVNRITRYLPFPGLALDLNYMDTAFKEVLQILDVIKCAGGAAVHIAPRDARAIQYTLGDLFWRLIEHTTKKFVFQSARFIRDINVISNCPKVAATKCQQLISACLDTVNSLQRYLFNQSFLRSFNKFKETARSGIETLQDLLHRSQNLSAASNCTCPLQAHGNLRFDPEPDRPQLHMEQYLHLGVFILSQDYSPPPNAASYRVGSIFDHHSASILSFLDLNIIESLGRASAAPPGSHIFPLISHPAPSRDLVQASVSSLPEIQAFGERATADMQPSHTSSHWPASSMTVNITSNSRIAVENFSREMPGLNQGRDTSLEFPEAHKREQELRTGEWGVTSADQGFYNGTRHSHASHQEAHDSLQGSFDFEPWLDLSKDFDDQHKDARRI